MFYLITWHFKLSYLSLCAIKKFSRTGGVLSPLLHQLTQACTTLFLPWTREVSERGRRLPLAPQSGEALPGQAQDRGFAVGVAVEGCGKWMITASGMRFLLVAEYHRGWVPKESFPQTIRTRLYRQGTVSEIMFTIHRFRLLVRRWWICMLLQHSF